ncbi:MAG: hypothetical protein HXS46_13775 [Theionarchaea archaeon]|nr:MAG: hypothetical protein AYK18_02605 [Theionarchaea archaeon DG-70]MBU7011752.1 hypothetical protein [Theionarchaea archaeon]
MKTIYKQAIGVWVLLLILAIINGVLRNEVYGPLMEELLAHQISTITAIVLFLVAMYVFFSKTNARYTGTDLIAIGALWLILTVVFEFMFGHYVMGNSWSRLFHDYNILEGRVWSLVLLTTVVGPFFIGKYILKRT